MPDSLSAIVHTQTFGLHFKQKHAKSVYSNFQNNTIPPAIKQETHREGNEIKKTQNSNDRLSGGWTHSL